MLVGLAERIRQLEYTPTTLSMARTTGERRPWRSVTSVCITSIIIIGLLLLIEDVVNLDVITHTEAVKHV